jgi:hypothetical protein
MAMLAQLVGQLANVRAPDDTIRSHADEKPLGVGAVHRVNHTSL